MSQTLSRILFSIFLSMFILCTVESAQATLLCSKLFLRASQNLPDVTSIPTDDYIFWPIEMAPIELKNLTKNFQLTGVLPTGQTDNKMHDSFKGGIVYFKDGQNYFSNKQLFVGEALPVFERDIYSALNVVFKSYSDRNIVSSNSINELINLENILPVNRRVYFVARDPILKSPKEVIRLFDASPKNNTVFRGGFARPEDKQIVSRLPIELEYPHLQLPERLRDPKDQYLIELGRLVKTSDVTESEISHIFSKVSYFIYENHILGSVDNKPPLVIYIEATAAGKRLYSGKYGFSTSFGPPEIGVSDRYILKMDAWEFVAKFLKKDKRTKFNQNPLQSSEHFYSELSQAMQHQHVLWTSKTVANKIIDTKGLGWLDANRSIFTDESIRAEKADFNQQFNPAKIPTITFWQEYRKASSQLLVHDQMTKQLINYTHQLLPKKGSILYYGNLDFIMPISLAKMANERILSLQGYSAGDVVDFSEIANGLHLNTNQLLINQPQKHGEFLYDAVVISDTLFRFQNSQQIDSFLKNIFKSLRSKGIVILKEPTPKDGTKNSFKWYTGIMTALEGKSSATYRDLFFTLEAAEAIADAEDSFNFLSAEKLLKMTQDAGFQIAFGERVLNLSNYLLVLTKP